MRTEPESLSAAQLRRRFETSLDAAVRGLRVSSEPFDIEVSRALNLIAAGAPDPPADVVEQARSEFEAQLDGSRAAAAREQLRALVVSRQP
ncbi:hypothetical protein ACFVAV_20170 [Nocardia sp. NPDC057663]|uniref:hypothetical protein n=1 Tax=Nocardia sp. NPDC057663 TaxID=3346201 RepID=UPI003671585F